MNKSTLLALCALPSALITSCSNYPSEKLPKGVAAFPACQRKPFENQWTTCDGISLPYLKALPAGKPTAVVIHVPGWDAVTGDYDSLTKEMVRHGYAVYASENRSFIYGPASEQGNARDWQPWVEDLKAFTRFVRAKHPGVSVIWHGQSFGAVEVLAAMADASRDNAPNALVIHSPGFVMLEQKHGLLGVVARCFPGVKVPHIWAMDRKKLAIANDPSWNARWMWSEDRLRSGYTLRFLTQTVKMGAVARKEAGRLKLPVLAMWGDADKLGLAGDERLRCQYNAFMEHELAGGRADHYHTALGGHLMQIGDGGEEAVAKVIAWLDAQ